MNKYIFPGADASCSLGWVVNQVEAAGFEVKNIDVLGVHYSATLWRWYDNWVGNREKVVEKYGERLVILPCQYVLDIEDLQVVPHLGLLPCVVDNHLPTRLSFSFPAHPPQEPQCIPPSEWHTFTCIYQHRKALLGTSRLVADELVDIYPALVTI